MDLQEHACAGRRNNHWAEFKSGKVTYRIVGMPDRDFPKVPDHREATYATVVEHVAEHQPDRLALARRVGGP